MQIQIFKKENILAMKSIKSRCKLPLNKTKKYHISKFFLITNSSEIELNRF